MAYQTDCQLDAKGLACPMPIVKTKKAMNDLKEGQVMEIQATDKGSTADLKAWATSTGHHYLGTLEEAGVFKHYVRKSNPKETKEETKHPHVMDLVAFSQKINNEHELTILDVREPAEYAFGHIPGAINIPLDTLEQQVDTLNKEHEIYVICRTGNRSDYAAQQLAAKGFERVINVVPGMNEWTGKTKQL